MIGVKAVWSARHTSITQRTAMIELFTIYIEEGQVGRFVEMHFLVLTILEYTSLVLDVFMKEGESQ